MNVKNRQGVEVELKVGDRVCPVGTTRRRLSYGYVRVIESKPHDARAHGKEQAAVYWPETNRIGDGWTSLDLIVLPKVDAR